MEYTLRKPKATDLFVASKILKTIGVKNIYNCFNNEELEEIKTLAKSKKGNADVNYEKVGLMVVTSVCDLLLEKLEYIQEPLIKFMSNLSGLKVKEIENLPPAEFMEMAITIIKMPEFVDFIKVVLKSFN
jgi:hypothetical protein